MQYRLDAPLDELLDMARQRFEVAFEPLAVGDAQIEVLQVQNMKEYLDNLVPTIKEDALSALPLWAKIWPAAFMLGHFLRHAPSKDKSLLEIGAGCGVTGLIAATQGFSEVVISDINEDALLFARINVLQNGMEDRVSVRKVDIQTTRMDRSFDYIVGAEILYLEPLHRALVKFINHHLAKRPEAEAILAKDYRRKAKKFFKLAERDFRMQEQTVGAKTTAGNEDSADRALFTIHRLRAK
ncbi:protein N-lysine methyltransferase family protein [Desulfovibrio mangrovi]|uniref:class I SAM-dependent methyltransferase n=1 Tax=Desulfovibrio mangrovi TaxID=2976983 RepID=UPI002246768D|nr:methyltransferase [Desulfovibrio mangrovi]UZP67994.1 protein N-lysine methyltransferase family protein [Desulfovibrio mangrovi]